MSDQSQPRAPFYQSAYFIVFLAPLFWTGNMTLARAFNDLLPPVGLSVTRWAIAFLIVAPFTWRIIWDQRALYAKHWKLVLALAATGIAGYNTLNYVGLQLTTAINVSLINSAMAMPTILLAWLVLGTRPTPIQIAGVLVAMSGAMTIVAQGDLGALLALRIGEGELWVLVAMTVWAVFSILLRLLPPGIHPMGLNTVIFGLGMTALLPFWAYEMARGVYINPTPGALIVIAYTGVFASAAAYWAWSKGVAELGPSTAILYIYTIPVMTTIAATVFLGESLEAHHLMGSALIAAGIALAMRKARG